MNKPVFRIVFFAAVFALLLTAGSPMDLARADAKKTAAPAQFWATRCNEAKDKKAPKYCEVFQRLLVQNKDKKEQLRVAELAIGYPPDKKGEARGVLILPLGVLLEGTPPLTIKIGNGNEFTFHVRYCDQGGCYAFLDLGAAQIQQMETSDKMTITFPSLAGKNLAVMMSLQGFGPALDKIKG